MQTVTQSRISPADRHPSASDVSQATLRVAINCMDVNPAFVGGVTTYVLGLLEGFARVASSCRFRAFVTPANQHLFNRIARPHNFEIVVIGDPALPLRNHVCRAALLSHSPRVYRRTSDTVFMKVRQLMDAESDIVYTPTPVLRFFNSTQPTVLTMHDIQHLHHPEFFNWSRRLSRRITYGLSAQHASFLQANSEYIKDDLMRHFPWLSDSQIAVIPSGVLIERFSEIEDAAEVSRKYELPERFLFFPAQLWPHKNHITVLRALKKIEIEYGLQIPLILTGEAFSAAPAIFKFISSESMAYVRHLGKVPFVDLVKLYHRAAFVMTASLHESSSLPILEAAAAGTPIIASRIPAIKELGQVLQLNLFDPLDVEEAARLVLKLWDDQERADSQSKHNLKHISFYSWENSARSYISLFRRIVTSSPVLPQYRALSARHARESSSLGEG